MPPLRIPAQSLAMLEEPGKLVTVEAGVIARAALRAELQRGIGSFLRNVRTKPAIVHGRFAGWRVLELFKKRPEVHVQELRAGDTVLKVNGRSVERPEQLKNVWDSLADAPELLIETERDAQRRVLRYAITD
jgi:type II secretory pathway component PulC